MYSSTLKKLLYAATATATIAFVPQVLASEVYKAGVDYKVISKPGKVDKPGMIEVKEFFWYGCPHCYRLDPHVQAWKKTKPADVNFVYSPAALNAVWEQNARGYYVTELMGVAEKLHTPLFNEINKNQKKLFDQASLANFYATQGVNKTQFNSLFYSFTVTGKVQQSKNLAIQYQLDGVPALVVNGKYVVSGEDGKALKIVNYLINKERASGAYKKAS